MQRQLFNCLPSHIHDMALFAVNTGCRDQVICHLRWEWEYQIEGSDSFVFIIPKEFMKNNKDRLVVLIKVARKVVNGRRNIHPKYVFSYRGDRLKRMLSTGWKNAREKVGLKHIRVHDLKHTYSSRLRAEKVSFEDRQDF